MSSPNKFKIILLLIILNCIPVISFSQQDPVRVACVGNSITEGIAMSTASLDSYPAALARFLGQGYDVRNFGKSGRTLLKKGDYPIWKEQVFTDAINFNPNIVIIALGTNDTKPQNWIYKDEFLKDYYEMIDTFKHGTANPEIYICYPLPSFSDAFDIRDSIIVADVIPMIKQITDSLNVKLIDFNTPFLDKSDLMPDGIHPLVEGSDLMAKIVFKELTGKHIEQLYENNVSFNKTAYQLNTELPQLIDENPVTSISFNSTSGPVVINLSDKYNIDMVRFDFSNSPPDCSFNVSTSMDSLQWQTVIDTTLSADKNRTVFVGTFNEVNANYVKFEINQGGIAADSNVVLNEMKIFESRPLHAPVLSYNLLSKSSASSRVKIFFDRASNCGEYIKFYRQIKDGEPFSLYSGYRSTNPLELTTTIRFGSLNRYYCVAYYNGVEVQSDTLTIISTAPTNIPITEPEIIPDQYSLSQNYPNPFNPETTIEFLIPDQHYVSIEIFNATGSLVQTIGNRIFPKGNNRIKWDGKNKFGVRSASGVYYYRLKIGGKTAQTKKMIFLQ